MKTILLAIAGVLIVLAYVLLGFGTLISVGYGLYMWAIADVAFKVALWTAFITWVKLIAAGLGGLLVASGITVSVK